MKFTLSGGVELVSKTDEVVVQFKVSPKIKKAIKAMALERDETIRSLILGALKESGLRVADHELGDRRRGGER